LAITESERALPGVLDQLEELLRSLQLQDEEIIVRSTGCPNGCARPYTAEIGLVGKAPGKYQIYLGSDGLCTRLNRVYRESVKQDEVIEELRPVLTRFARERQPGERFGPFCERVLWTDPVPAVSPS
jgi:sulfite reductase (NADPH) hemoprotein beta-component